MASVSLDAISSSSNSSSTDDVIQQLRRMEHTLQALQHNMDDFYFVSLTAITFAMQCGFAFMEVGLVRTKNTTNILLKNTIDAFVGCLSYWLFGYAIAWGEGNTFVGWNHWAMSYLAPEKFSMAFYQLIFANTASTIVSGAVAERLNLPCYFVYGVILTGFSYPFVSRWGWHDHGWLKEMGFHDFGGSGIVHMFAGACAFVASTVIGPRAGRFSSKSSGTSARGDSEHHGHIPGHSLPFLGLGCLLLIFGFIGFNAASQLSMSKPGDGPIITYSAFNTLLGCSGGALSALFINRFLPFWGNYWSYVAMVNGAVAGMAAICAGCDSLAPWGAVVTGIMAGGAFILGRALLEKLQIDDPIDAFPIHFCGGLVGLVTAPFLVSDGIFFKQDRASAVILGVNLLGGVVIVAWAALWCVPMFGFLNWLGVLRIPPEMEESGADVPKHNEIAYPKSAWMDGTSELVESKLSNGNTWMPSQNYDKMDNPLSLRRRGGYFLEPISSSHVSSSPASLVSVNSRLDLGQINPAMDQTIPLPSARV